MAEEHNTPPSVPIQVSASPSGEVALPAFQAEGADSPYSPHASADRRVIPDRRSTPEESSKVWSASWKSAATILGILVLTAGIGAAVVSKYASKEELKTHAEGNVQSAMSFQIVIDKERDDLVQLKQDIAGMKADIAATRQAADDTRADIRRLTDRLLDNPITPRRQP